MKKNLLKVTKMKLRNEVKVVLAFMVFATLNLSLKDYNNDLRKELALKQLEIENYKVVEQITLKSTGIEPCSTSSVKTYMDRSKITDETSDQHIFIEENMEARNGLWFDREGYIGVALGSQFGEIGSRWVFELSSGELIYAVKIDEKDDKHTINGCEHKLDGSVIEFVIDTESSPYWIGENGLILNGNFNNLEYFEGTIESIRKESD